MLDVNQVFTPDYFVALYNVTAAAGVRADRSLYCQRPKFASWTGGTKILVNCDE